MKYFLDSAKIDEITYAAENWGIDGVTTNPRHVLAAGKPFKAVIEEIAAAFKGRHFPISVEIDPHLTNVDQMVKEAQALSALDDNFVIKIPCHEPGIEIVTQIATDNEGGGRKAAEAMIEAVGAGGGQVAILHLKQAESCRLRVRGFREVISQHNASGGAPIEIVTELESGGAKDIGFKAMEDALQAWPELRGVFAINDPAALGARAALEKAGRAEQVVIVGFDGQPEGKQAIREGKIYADPIQFPDQMGEQVVEAIIRWSRGETLPPEILIPTSLYRRANALADPALSGADSQSRESMP